MSRLSLLARLARSSTSSDLRERVKETLAELQDPCEPAWAGVVRVLEDIACSIEAGKESEDLLEALHQQLGQVELSKVGQLEWEILNLSARLPSWEWNTDTYQEACEAARHFEAGRADEGEALARSIADRMEQAWSHYQELAIEEREVTAEAVAAHRLLERGQLDWLAALEKLRYEPGRALLEAEQANRLLVALQKYCQRFEQHG